MHILALLVPEHQPANSEAVPQIVNARRAMSATINPTQLPTQTIEDTMNLPVTQRLTQKSPTGGDEEGRLAFMRSPLVT
jgi:hypothetical protein